MSWRSWCIRFCGIWGTPDLFSARSLQGPGSKANETGRLYHTHSNATLREMHPVFGVRPNTLWVRLNQPGITLKKLTKYQERDEYQRWLLVHWLETRRDRKVFYLDECGVDHRYFANGAGHSVGRRFIKPFRVRGAAAPASFPLRKSPNS